ncbi:hypothetical protein HUJ04_007890 [Dendroctonus ponderosae]|nr:hypothetical protein HUJ04_007890 [Dendroctonus ponderosae]
MSCFGWGATINAFHYHLPITNHSSRSTMQNLLIAALLATLASADVKHLLNQRQAGGYQYEGAAPPTSYGVPIASVLGNSAQSAEIPQLSLPSYAYSGAFGSPSTGGVQLHSFNSFSTPAPSVDFGGVQVSTSSPYGDFSTAAPSVDLSGLQVSTPSSIDFAQYSQPNSYQFLSSFSQPTVQVPSFGISQFAPKISNNAGSAGSLNEAFGVATDAAAASSADSDVSKQLYFFAAPEEEEEEEVEAKIDLPAAPPKKTYKIIFIKAPAYRNKAVINVPAPPQTEEKTLVYVLVKKPEGKPTVRFQAGAALPQPKPEVFFIKYKTQKEAEAAVAEIQSKHGANGQIIANLPAGAVHPDVPGQVFESSTPASHFESRISSQVSQQEENAQFGLSVSPSPVTFGNDFVDSQKVFGGGIAPSQPEEVESAVASTDQPEEEQRQGGAESPDSSNQSAQVAGFASYGPPKY